jgi:hypothetical protein
MDCCLSVSYERVHGFGLRKTLEVLGSRVDCIREDHVPVVEYISGVCYVFLTVLQRKVGCVSDSMAIISSFCSYKFLQGINLDELAT